MRHSYIVALRSGKITLMRELRDQLNLREDCALYGVLTSDGASAIISSLPPSSWNEAFRLVIYTAAQPGSLLRATQVISEMKINLLNSWAAATSAAGELCWTSIVELPLELRQADRKTVETTIHQRLSDAGAISSSEMFREPGGLTAVHVVPLSVLAALSRDCHGRRVHELNVKGWTVDLNEDSSKPEGPSLFHELRSFANPRPTDEILSALITPDTEERYFRIAPLPRHCLLRIVSFPIAIESETSEFRGYFQAALKVLADSQMNVYSAKNILLAKPSPRRGRPAEEVAEFSFVVDVGSTKACSYSLCELKDNLATTMDQALQIHGAETGGKVRIIKRGLRFSMPPGWPRCFFATNAKPEMGRSFVMAFRIFTEIRALGLHPVHVDIAQTRTVYEDVTKLLRVCPILVAVHLPEEKLRFRTNEGSTLSQESYAPSDWVVFEEAFMHGIQPQRGIFRMRHSAVKKPAFYPGLPEHMFTEDSFFRELRLLADQIDRYMQDEEWRVALRDSEDIADRLRLPQIYLERDLEAYFIGQIRRFQLEPLTESNVE